MAFSLVISFASASLTADSVTVSVEQGATGTATIVLTAADNVSGVNLTSNTLTSGSNFLADALITFDFDNFNIEGGDAQNVIVSVGTAGVALGTFTGNIGVEYDNGTVEMLEIPIAVTVIESSVGAHMDVPANVNFGELERSLDDEINNYTKTITIKNTGTETLTGIVFSSNFDADFKVGFENVLDSLAVGASQTVDMNLIIPADQDAGSIADRTVTIVTSNGLTKVIPVIIEAENYLSIDDIEVKITHRDGDSETEDGLEDDDTVDEDVYAGDEVEITISVENNNNLDIDIDDVKVSIDNSEMDADDDDKIDISEGDTEDFVFTFDVDNKADDGTENLKITVEGRDDENAEHSLDLIIKFNIEELKDFISIESIDFPSTVSCGDNVRLEVLLENIGTDDQSKAAVRIEIPQLNIIDWERDLEIKDGDDDLVIFNIEIPDDANPGSYYGEIESFYDRDEDSDDDSFDFRITCGTSSSDDDDEEDDNDDIVIIPDSGDQSSGNDGNTPTGSITAVGKDSFFESTGYLVLLTVLVAVLIVVILVLIITGRK